MRMTKLAVAVSAVVLMACGSTQGPTSSAPSPSMSSPSPSATALPSPSPSPSPAAPAPRPSAYPVAFSGLPNGTYPVHLHSACNGSQQFHITVLQSLVVRQGAGAISVPAGYFGRGLCVIVYSSPALARVLTTRRI